MSQTYTISEQESTWLLITYFGFWTLGWTVLFYCLTAIDPWWASRFPRSTKMHENDRNWSARNLLGVIHALFVSAITVPAIFILWPATDEVRFGATGHLATCSIGPDRAELAEQWSEVSEAVAMAGLAFTAFTLADVGISAVHGLATADYIAHHIAFITAGMIIRGHCMLPFNAAILLAMEASTPFLNVLLFFRHRGTAYKKMVQVNGIIFVCLFVLFRLVLNTYGAITLWYHWNFVPAVVPRWQAWFLMAAIAAGAAVQFVWFPSIAKIFGSGMSELLGRSVDNGVSDAGLSSPLAGDAVDDGNSSGAGNTPTDYGSIEDEANIKRAKSQTEAAPEASGQTTSPLRLVD